MTEALDIDRLGNIFFPYAQARTRDVRRAGNRFAYYTTAEVAASILKHQMVWLRNAMVMNDFREVEHGFDCLRTAWEGPSGKLMKEALAISHPDLPADVEEMFNNLWPSIRTDTYLYCFSEHDSSEDLRGRLSMWRAYGSNTGVALVFNGRVMHSTSNVLGAYTSPVLYANPPEFADDFMNVATRIRSEAEYLKYIDPGVVKELVFQMMRFAVLCTKHPGFREEREWRVIASPTLHPDGRNRREVEVVRGVPQLVVKIDLKNDPDRGLTGLELPELIERIIIGPCEFPAVTALALNRLLANAGITDGRQRIFITDIPLRHNT